MKKSNQEAIRALLRQHPEGLTVPELTQRMRAATPPIRTAEASVRKSLKEMPDTYVDRWKEVNAGAWAGVWCSIVPPANCPKPDGPPHKHKRARPCPPTEPNTTSK